jgi:bifunctional DNA-binding transcriptional regulator/antitoxin component of YhaV-PrlF toxin-antitoxin module
VFGVVVVRVSRGGVVALPEGVLREAGLREGMLLRVRVEGGRIVLGPVNLWGGVWGRGRGRGSAAEAELELDREEEGFWERRRLGVSSSSG